MRYFPQTPEDIATMLDRIGANHLDELFNDVPSELRLRAEGYDIPQGQSELEIRRYFDTLRSKNRNLVCFAGAGFYDHYTPAVVADIARRSEFLTAYTPYQPEISQGTLGYIFEYQSMISELTGLEVSNASLYDGSTATAEAMLMMVAAARKKNRVIVSGALAPTTLDVVHTYARYHRVDITVLPVTSEGRTDAEAMKSELAKGDVAGVIVASPNYFGVLEDLEGWADAIHSAKATFAINTHASALGVVRSQAEWGADIAVGEAQSLGCPLNFGGPGLGYMSATKALMRKMPGRIIGATTDADGNRVFVLTLQAREQHIRREKATSNICSNQGIMTLYAAIYLSVVGPKGLAEINRLSADAAHYAARRIATETSASLVYPTSPFLNEFVVRIDNRDAVLDTALKHGILAGVPIDSDKIMMAFTEQRTRDQIDALVDIFKNTVSK